MFSPMKSSSGWRSSCRCSKTRSVRSPSFARSWRRSRRFKGTHVILGPLIETFLTEVQFGEKIELFDPGLFSRLSQHQDVREHIRATFVPLIVARTTTEVKRLSSGTRVRLRDWKPFQVTQSATHPAIPASRTLFNLVPCNRKLEVAMAQTLDRTFKDVAAFAKNAGPQALRIDYLTDQRRLSLYTPDFLARKNDGCISSDRNKRTRGQGRAAESIGCGGLVQSGFRIGASAGNTSTSRKACSLSSAGNW